MIKDLVSNSFKLFKRNKKNKILITIFSLLFFLLFVDIIIMKNFMSYYNYAINNNIGFRTLSVDYLTGNKDDAIKELEQIEHVSEVYPNLYDGVSIDSDLTLNGLDGSIYLSYGSKNTAPQSIKGKNIDELSPGELICPHEFYPDSNISDILHIDESKFLYEKDILNREITGTYYVPVTDGLEIKEEEYTKKFKIVGLYDGNVFRTGINNCFATMQDIMEIQKSYNSYEYVTLNVIVDKNKNIDTVSQDIKKLGNYEVGDNTVAYIDKMFVGNLFFITIFFVVIIVYSILLILKNYISKKIKNDSKILGILRSCGYTKKQIIIQEIFENIFVLGISFLISSTLFSVLFLILEKNLFYYFKYINFFVSNNVLLLISIFIVVLFIAELINYYLLNKKLSNQICDILREK